MKWLLKQNPSFKIFKRYMKNCSNHEGRLFSSKTQHTGRLSYHRRKLQILDVGAAEFLDCLVHAAAVKQKNVLTEVRTQPGSLSGPVMFVG
jgi:hypothetical protein